MTEAPHPTAAVGAGYNPYDPAFAHDPYPFYTRARTEAPVALSPIYGMWLVSGYQEILTVLKDPTLFSSADNMSCPFPWPPEVHAILNEGDNPIAPGLFNNDPPGHTRNRALAATAFTPARIAAMEPAIRSIANDLIDSFVKDGKADLVTQFAYSLPMTVIAKLAGLSPDEMALVKRLHDDWMKLFTPGLPLSEQLECARSIVTYQQFYANQIEERRKSPRDDLITGLVQARLPGETPFAVPEMVSQLMILLSAAHETTTSLIASMVRLLLEDPSLWRAVGEDPALALAAIEETLRFEPPVQMEPRVTTADTVLGGVSIPKGARIHVLYGAVNRDPIIADDPDTFNIRRPAVKHMAFGYGVHFCLGASLARLEGRVALEVIRERLPGVRLAPGFQMEYVPSFYFRQPKQIDIVWDV